MGNANEPLERLKPNEAECILGLRIPILGTMDSELKYRKDQIYKLALKLYQAPINHRKACVIYQTRYKPMIRYCFPVTTFSREELHSIQRKFIFLLLPKMGMNQHTPRDVIYGPISRGGRGIMDIRLEQPIIHIETTIGHMRRKDNAGRSLEASYYGHQIVAGTSSPFHTLEPESIPYMPINTRWSYIWKTSKQYNLTIEKFNQFIYGPFPREVQANIVMDKMANEARLDKTIKRGRRRTYQGMAIGLFNNNGMMITNLREFLYDRINGK